jgi:hypothetical protein
MPVLGRSRPASAYLVVPRPLALLAPPPVPPAPPVGSWWGLVSVLEHRRQEAEAWDSMPPMACPNDGEPLINAPATMAGSGCQLYCKYDGWQYPRDWRPDVHPARGWT